VVHDGRVEEQELVELASRDEVAFGRLVAPYRGELHAHCYRMLGSVQDAEDAVQNALLGAWQGLKAFEGRSSVRSWLYRIATNACLRIAERRSKLVLAKDFGPARHSVDDLGVPVTESVWVEPYPLDPEASYELRESVELAFVAALQHLPATQRAVLILREVLAFSAAEVAVQLDTTVASVNSALQRARKTLDGVSREQSQQEALRDLGEDGRRELVAAFVTAFEKADVDGMLALLVEDVRFTMPPLPAWYSGITDVGRFFRERVFETPWLLRPTTANGQLAFACYQSTPDGYVLGALNVLTLRGDKIVEITGFLDPASHAAFDLPATPPGEEDRAGR